MGGGSRPPFEVVPAPGRGVLVPQVPSGRSFWRGGGGTFKAPTPYPYSSVLCSFPGGGPKMSHLSRRRVRRCPEVAGGPRGGSGGRGGSRVLLSPIWSHWRNPRERQPEPPPGGGGGGVFRNPIRCHQRGGVRIAWKHPHKCHREPLCVVPGGPIEDPRKSHQEPPGLYLMEGGGVPCSPWGPSPRKTPPSPPFRSRARLRAAAGNPTPRDPARSPATAAPELAARQPPPPTRRSAPAIPAPAAPTERSAPAFAAGTDSPPTGSSAAVSPLEAFPETPPLGVAPVILPL